MIRNEYLQAAVLTAVLLTILLMLSQWAAFRRARARLQRDLDRIFEQVDMLRFDSQQPELAGMSPGPSTSPVPGPSPARPTAVDAGIGYAAALELASRGADEDEITSRCGLSNAEARILVAMQGMKGKAHGVH